MKKLLQLLLVGLVFFASCKPDEEEKPIVEKEFGKVGTHQISIFTADDYKFSSIYYPKDISTMSEKTPIVFVVSGWSDHVESTKYETLLQFIASHGYTVVFVTEGATTDYQFSIDAINTIIDKDFAKENIMKYVDKTKFGVIGHSAGGGIVFTLIDRFKNVGYGENGRFVMGLDPWFAFGMDETDMENLPSNLNVSILKFGAGGNNDKDGTDARIPLTEYYLLKSIPDKNKDYQIFENADHLYPYKTEIPGIIESLDALMEYTFVDQAEYIRKIALEKGNDDPYANGNGIQVVLDEYKYPCDGANTLIDYCKIVH